MASLYESVAEKSVYKDREYQGTQEEYDDELKVSCTLYIGNLSFQCTEEQLYELFKKAGEIRRIIMGLDKVQVTPCGFCFVEYYTHEDAADAQQWINSLKCDGRPIRVDWDIGFSEGRQYGRGKSGGQVRDEQRDNYDPGRGGYGKVFSLQEERTEIKSEKKREDDESESESESESSSSDSERGKKEDKKRAREDDKDDDIEDDKDDEQEDKESLKKVKEEDE